MKKRVQKTLTRHKMLKRGDRIAIGVSGGKDSIALLHILNKIEKDFPESELIAITIDEGIENYREEGLLFAKKHVEELELEHHIYSFENDFGYGLDEILKILGERGKEREFGACSYCGILRRKIGALVDLSIPSSGSLLLMRLLGRIVRMEKPTPNELRFALEFILISPKEADTIVRIASL